MTSYRDLLSGKFIEQGCENLKQCKSEDLYLNIIVLLFDYEKNSNKRIFFLGFYDMIVVVV